MIRGQKGSAGHYTSCTLFLFVLWESRVILDERFRMVHISLDRGMECLLRNRME